MKTIEIIFFVLAILAIFAAIMLVVNKNPIKSILWLLVIFFVISANYIILNAQFLAVVNLIVYAGAIMVLFLFVLMLINLQSLKTDTKKYLILIGSLIAAGSFGLSLISLISQNNETKQAITVTNTGDIGLIENLGKALFSDYVFPFELTGILFLTAIIGGVILTKKEKNI